MVWTLTRISNLFYGTLFFLCFFSLAIWASILSLWLLPVTLLLILYSASLFPLLLLLNSQSKKCLRINLKSSIPLNFPKICCITGEPATEMHRLESYENSLYYFQHRTIGLPFSLNGRAQYLKNFPISWKIYNTSQSILTRIPRLLCLLYWACFFWLYVVVIYPVCGLASIFDLYSKKYQMLQLNKVYIKDGNLCGVDILVSNQYFADEFWRENADAAKLRKKWRFWDLA